MNDCKTNRRIKRRYLDERAKYSAILPRWGCDCVRRTKRGLIYPAVRREKTKPHGIDWFIDSSPCCTIHRLRYEIRVKNRKVK